jgi:hypothetical protein
LGNEISQIGLLRAGSPLYIRALQPAGAPSFTLSLGSAYSVVFPAATQVRLGILRLR